MLGENSPTTNQLARALMVLNRGICGALEYSR